MVHIHGALASARILATIKRTTHVPTILIATIVKTYPRRRKGLMDFLTAGKTRMGGK